MANYSTLLKTWGSAGSEFPTGYQYQEGEQPVDAWDNFLIYNLINDVKNQLIPLTNDRIESDKGTASPGGSGVSSVESAHLYAETDAGGYWAYDNNASSWRRLLYADGPLLEGSMDVNGNSIKDTTGNLTLDGDVEANQLILEATSTTFDGSHNSTSTISPDDHHIRPVPGTNITEDGSNNFNVEQGSGSGLNADSIDGLHDTDLVEVAGDTMSGNLNMDTNDLQNVGSINASASFGNMVPKHYNFSHNGSGNDYPNTWTTIDTWNPSGDVLFNRADYQADGSYQYHQAKVTFKDGTTANDPSFADCSEKIIDKVEFQTKTTDSVGSYNATWDMFTYQVV